MKKTLFKTAILGLSLCGLSFSAYSQTLIKGEIIDKSNQEYVENANIQNIYTRVGMSTLEDGKFRIEVKTGQLIEISKIGYQTLRIRIQDEKTPSFYKLELDRRSRILKVVDIRGRSLNYVKDSIRFRETYNVVVSQARKGDVDMRSMPLAMLSKKQREIWAFQEMYDRWEEEKYVDFVFNKALVNKITYLKKEELERFMRLYRPSAQFVRQATEYEYLEYIKSSYYRYKRNSQ